MHAGISAHMVGNIPGSPRSKACKFSIKTPDLSLYRSYLAVAAHKLLLQTPFFLRDAPLLLLIAPLCWRLAKTQQNREKQQADNLRQLLA